METKYIWNNLHIFKYVRFFSSIDEFLAAGNQFNYFKVKDCQLPGKQHDVYCDRYADDYGIKFVYTDMEHPILCDLNIGCLINPEFYKLHRDRLVQLEIECVLNTEFRNYTLNERIYSFELAKQIIETRNPNTLSITGVDLSEEEIAYFKKQTVNISWMDKNGDTKKLASNIVLGTNTLSYVQENKWICLDEGFSADQLDNLKYVQDGSILQFCAVYANRTAYYLNFRTIAAAIKKCEELGKNVEITMAVDKRSEFPFELFKTIKLEHVKVFIGADLKEYTLEQYINEDQKLEIMVQDIKNSSLSPLEKYMAVYRIAKNFKEYRENNDDLDEARYLQSILDGDYMVCVGFAKLLVELLKKVGIEASSFSVSVDTSYDDGFTVAEKEIDMAGHQRILVSIVDHKYNIDGIYVADPTWDNDLGKDLINHALMTYKQTETESRMMSLQNYEAIFGCNTFQEYNQKMNFFLNREYQSNKESSHSPLLSAYSTLLYDIMGFLYDLDFAKYKELKDRYPSYIDDEQVYREIFTELGYYFIRRNNKKVELDTLLRASMVVERELLGATDENLEAYYKRTIKENDEQYLKDFPYIHDESNEHNLLDRTESGYPKL